MMKKILYFVGALLLASCDNGQKAAEDLLRQAESAFSAGEYNNALVLLDSIDSAYPKCFDVRKAGRNLSYRVNAAVAQQTLNETNRLIEEYATKINELTKDLFVFEKSEYDELGRYIFKGSEVEKNVQRTYIHAAVDEYGVTQLISTYSGPRDINHTALKIVAANGETIVTENIPFNDGSNYHYVIDGTHYESVTYVGGKDNGALAFVADNADDASLKFFLVCPDTSRDLPVSVSALDRKALAATYELSSALSSLLRYTQENKVAQAKLSLFGAKLSQQSPASETAKD